MTSLAHALINFTETKSLNFSFIFYEIRQAKGNASKLIH